jgi:hypothetical protein
VICRILDLIDRQNWSTETDHISPSSSSLIAILADRSTHSGREEPARPASRELWTLNTPGPLEASPMGDLQSALTGPALLSHAYPTREYVELASLLGYIDGMGLPCFERPICSPAIMATQKTFSGIIRRHDARQ